MIEKIIYDYLTSALAVPVGLEIPAAPPVSFAVIEKTGSGEENKIFSATVAVQSYGPTLWDAASLNEEVKAAMEQLDTLPEVCRCDLNSDYNFTDTSSKKYRYQAVFDIVHY